MLRELADQRIKMEEEQRIKREEFERELARTRLEQSSAEQQERASREIVQQVPLWDDKTDPEAFIEALVMAMTEAKWPEEQWIPTLRKWLTGKALSTFREISLADDAPIVTLKEDLLKWMGATIDNARETIWLSKPRAEEDLPTFTKKMLTAINRVKATWSNPEDAAQELFMGAMFRVFSPETMLHLQDATGDSNYRQAERISKIWIARDYFGRCRMLRGDYHSTNSSHRQKNRDWSTNKKEGDHQQCQKVSPLVRAGVDLSLLGGAGVERGVAGLTRMSGGLVRVT